MRDVQVRAPARRLQEKFGEWSFRERVGLADLEAFETFEAQSSKAS